MGQEGTQIDSSITHNPPIANIGWKTQKMKGNEIGVRGYGCRTFPKRMNFRKNSEGGGAQWANLGHHVVELNFRQ